MKKFVSMLLVLMLMLSMAACGGETETQPTEATPTETSAPVEKQTEPPVVEETEAQEEITHESFVFSCNGIEIPMNAEAAPILEQLGEPVSYTEETSCAFEGLDKTYFYGSFYLQTYPKGDADYIFCIWLVDDTVNTGEGIYIGAAQADVENAYGTSGYNGSNAYLMTAGDTKLTVILEEGVVSSIQYDAIVE